MTAPASRRARRTAPILPHRSSAGLIVLGRHGAGRTLHLLGNVAHQVSPHAAVPVLLAEPPEPPEPPHRDAGATHGRHRAHVDGDPGDTHPATGSPRRT